MQHSTAHRNGIDLAGECDILVVRRNTGAAHDGYIAGAEAGVRRIRARHFDQRNVPNGAEKAAVPVLVGLQRPCGAVLNRLVRSGALCELSFVSRTRPIDRNIQQFREVDVRRRKRNADHALGHLFNRGNLGQSVVVRRTFVFQHSLETFGNITCRQLRTRPELDALFYRKAERGSVARIVLAQLVFECKIAFYLKKTLVKRLTQHAVDLGAVHDRIERCARAIPRQTEIRVRHIHVVYRCAVAVVSLSKWERAAAEHDQSRHCQRQRTFFPTFHCIDPFAYRQIMPPCTPRTPCVTRCDQNSSE